MINRCKYAKSKLEYRYFEKYSIYLSINISRKQTLRSSNIQAGAAVYQRSCHPGQTGFVLGLFTIILTEKRLQMLWNAGISKPNS
jgi:hypothetical protein